MKKTLKEQILSFVGIKPYEVSSRDVIKKFGEGRVSKETSVYIALAELAKKGSLIRTKVDQTSMYKLALKPDVTEAVLKVKAMNKAIAKRVEAAWSTPPKASNIRISKEIKSKSPKKRVNDKFIGALFESTYPLGLDQQRVVKSLIEGPNEIRSPRAIKCFGDYMASISPLAKMIQSEPRLVSAEGFAEYQKLENEFLPAFLAGYNAALTEDAK